MSNLSLKIASSNYSTPSLLSDADPECQNNTDNLKEIQSENLSSIETPVVVIRGASKSYGSKKNTNIVLQDLNLTISQGTM